MNEEAKLFSRFYVQSDSTERETDSPRFRNRLSAYITNGPLKSAEDKQRFSQLIKQELGVVVPVYLTKIGTYFPKLDDFFTTAELRDLLDCIGLMSRFLVSRRDEFENNRWISFVERAFEEEGLGYSVNSYGAVRHRVDSEFERNRLATLAGLDSPKHSAAKALVERASSHIVSLDRDTRLAVREMFEAVETLLKVQLKTNEDLDERLVERAIIPLVNRRYSKLDPTALSACSRAIQGLKSFVSAGHPYRHGQQADDLRQPPLEFAISYVSLGCSWIRWLIDITEAVPEGNALD